MKVTSDVAAANKEQNEEAIREEWIKVMQVRLVHDELQKCHRAEGENHYQVCAPIAKVYADLLKEAKVKGYRTIDV
ncbi:nadh-ubiquinone oxidoreductase 12 kda mitochondrial precursor [Malassezia pachydermatis]|uniref:Nadh-ubiquinone oxidoreductase 12 kDa mitochondrial n=1 Tax=Malassezia pachydermatis TaxID=77020 RepID=A0A0M8MYY3_9BASI|nr:nadh-ubiquinone oxidoreductase 12 kda mitochondrial precursor [Malassezia pachydermatis]KOS16530.1 nadh-ubiquinone oxidoreductase 12 kda mitochondrial precursor [Malassezia pachydermatis]